MINSAKIIEELVSVDAWHDAIVEGGSNPLHLSVTFSDARIMGSQDSPIEFAVELRRATVEVILSSKLKAHVDTVMEVHPVNVVTGTTKTQHANSSHSKSNTLAASAKFSETPTVAASAKHSQTDEIGAAQTLQVSQNSSWPIRATKRKIGQNYAWDCRPLNGETLSGPAFDNTQSVLQFYADGSKRLEDEQVSLKISCNVEDVYIDEDQFEPRWWVIEKFGNPQKKNMKAAIQALRHVIADAGLEVGNLDSKYAEIVIADIIANAKLPKS